MKCQVIGCKQEGKFMLNQWNSETRQLIDIWYCKRHYRDIMKGKKLGVKIG